MKSIRNKIMAFGAVAALTLAFASCTTYRPVAASSGVVGEKKGEASASYILYFPLNQNNSMLEAANNGGIKNVATVDQKVFTVLGLYTKVTTIVTGN